MDSALFTSGKDDWETPPEFFNRLNDEFKFTLDPCCNHETAKCRKHYTPSEDGLKQNWEGETVFVNPPYSSGNQNAWIKKCFDEAQKPNTVVVALLPARTDTARFHDYILGKAEIRFVRGRLKFGGMVQHKYFDLNDLNEDGQPKEKYEWVKNVDPAPFPSMIAIWR